MLQRYSPFKREEETPLGIAIKAPCPEPAKARRRSLSTP